MMERRLFGTDGIRGDANRWPMSPEFLIRIGRAISRVLPGEVILGKDTRQSSDMLEAAFASGLCSGGSDVFLTGVFPTPGIAHLVKVKGVGAGAVISASHNPPNENGLKLFGKEGKKLDDATEVRIEEETPLEGNGRDRVGRIFTLNEAKEIYLSFLEETIKEALPLKRLEVVVDCANGALSWILPEVLERLGLRIIRINCEPDGRNINLGCGALFPEVISKAVKENRADMGFSYDGDGDRVIACTEEGRVLDGDLILSILASFMKKRGSLMGDVVVGTVMSNLGLELFLKEIGVGFVRSKVGDRYLLKEMEGCGAVLGGEPSGHIIHLGHHTTGDGALTSLLLISIVSSTGIPLSKLGEEMRPFPQSLLNVRVKRKPPLDEVKGLRECVDDIERRLGGMGRVVVRYSGTEGVCRVMVEGREEGKIREACRRIADLIKKEIG
jgi:phosphoglucosamine mutase